MLLSTVTLLPLVFALLIWLTPKKEWVRPVALVLAVVEFGVSLLLLQRFDKSNPALQLVENIPWVPEFGISYFLGIDGLSLWLVILTAFLTPLVMIASWNAIDKSLKGFHISLFVLSSAMIGAFLAMDAILFYVFFELSLIPMYFIVGIWGGKARVYATLKFFIFTMLGSLMMLLAIVYLMLMTRDTLGQMTSSVLAFYQLKIPFIAGDFLNPQTLLFAAFSLAFAIKVPLFPFHSWQPDAYVEAPTPGSVMLAAVMAKMGSYGFMRFVIPLFPEAAEHYSWLFLFLGVTGILYGALIAMIQPDFKRLIAYSSFSHMGYIMIGLFALNTYGLSGSLYQMLSHGVSTGALFLLAGMIYERTKSRDIVRYGGLAKALPLLSIAFLISTLASIAVPMTNGFVGEFMILMGTFEANRIYGMVAVLGVILGAVYMLWMVQRMFFGQPGELVSKSTAGLKDLSIREFAVLTPLVVLIFWMGIFPNHFLDWSKTSIDHLVRNKDNYQLAIIAPSGSSAVAVQSQDQGEGK